VSNARAIELREQLSAMGARIRAAREAAGLSQEALADIAGLHRTYVGGVERGERNVTVGSLLTIARSLGLDARELLPPSGT
jgi:transcriptional regulator with XRE-family HTH domain